MLGKLSVIVICSWLAACASSTPAPETAATEPGTEPAHEAPPAPEEPPSEAEAPAAEAPQGRLAFTQCDPEHRPQACTKEYRPVCAEVDNGVRCVTTPCDSTDQKEFSTGCTACADPKTQGYWPVACAELTGSSAP